jgi:hypothetical protein
MFANTTLIAEIARQRQSEIQARAERRHRLFRGPMTGPVASRTITLPSLAARTSPSEARLA